MSQYNVYFIADLHLGHKNILFHQPNRVSDLNLKDNQDIEGMDEYIYNMWSSTLKRGDHVYLLGDVFLGTSVDAWKCIQRLKKAGVMLHLIVGNHDKHIPKFKNQFASIDYIKTVTFKKKSFDFLDEDFRVCMCHYPMYSWPDKCRGCALLYGHVHSTAPFLDADTDDLMVNVGFDTPFANYQLIPLEKVWRYFYDKRGGLPSIDYVNAERKENRRFVG